MYIIHEIKHNISIRTFNQQEDDRLPFQVALIVVTTQSFRSERSMVVLGQTEEGKETRKRLLRVMKAACRTEAIGSNVAYTFSIL